MKHVLIVGGNCTLGNALAKKFKKNNYEVIIAYHHNLTKQENIHYIQCDVRSKKSIDNLITRINKNYGNIDIMINLAVLCLDSYFYEKTKEEFMQVLEVNLVGSFMLMQSYLKNNHHGLVINMSSTDALITGNYYNLDYATSKAGIITLTKVLSGISDNTIVCICPNWIDTSSTRNMSLEYLTSELKRIKQSRLIKVSEFVTYVDEIIHNPINGGIYLIDVKDGKLWKKLIP